MELNQQEIEIIIEALAEKCRLRQERSQRTTEKAFENGYMGGLMDARDALEARIRTKAHFG